MDTKPPEKFPGFKDKTFYESFDERLERVIENAKTDDLFSGQEIPHVFNTLLNGIFATCKSSQINVSGFSMGDSSVASSFISKMRRNTIDKEQAQELIEKLISGVEGAFGTGSRKKMEKLWNEDGTQKRVSELNLSEGSWNPFEEKS